MAKTRKPEKFIIRFGQGLSMHAVDSYNLARLEAKGYKVGNMASVQITQPRNLKFNGMAHKLGELVEKNIEGFEGMDAHSVLKRLQAEAGVACEEVWIKVPKVGYVPVRWPLSLSFASMDQGDFKVTMRGLSRHIAAEYWPTLKPEQIEEMAGVMVDE